MTTKHHQTSFTWAFFIGIALTVSCAASGLGPQCTEYVGDNGCCIKAAAGDPAQISVCKDLAAQYASYPSRDQAEANCQQALASAQCSGSSSGGQPSAACTRYLACVAKATPDGYPGALSSYGPGSPCWASDVTAPTCTDACVQGLNVQRQSTPDIAECASCAVSADCWADRPVCNTATRLCVACVKDGDCSGSLCQNAQCVPGCRINGAFVAANDPNPANTCQSCQPAVSTTAWSTSPPGTQCAFGSVCSGTCRPGCYIDGAFRATGTLDPSSTCRRCDPTVQTAAWSNVADGTTCGTGMTCGSGVCGGTTTTPNFGLQTSGVTTTLQALWGSSSTNIFAGGVGGVILHTTNGGATWTKQVSGVTYDIDWMWGSSSTDVYAVGNNGTVLHTIDGGTTWTKLTAFAGTAAVVNMWGSSKTDVYAVAQNLGLYHSINSGVSWTKLTTPTTDLWAVWGSAKTDVYAVGGNGTILHSTDSGTTWVTQNSGVSDILYTIWGSGKTDVIAAGENGTLLSSTDSGVTWNPLLATSSTLFWSGFSRSSKERYAVGQPGIMLYNTGTSTWTKLTPTTSDMLAIWGNSTDIFVAGGNGVILHSPG